MADLGRSSPRRACPEHNAPTAKMENLAAIAAEGVGTGGGDVVPTADRPGSLFGRHAGDASASKSRSARRSGPGPAAPASPGTGAVPPSRHRRSSPGQPLRRLTGSLY